MFPKMQPPNSQSHTSPLSTAEKLKDAARSASDLAKSKAKPIYASCQANQS